MKRKTPIKKQGVKGKDRQVARKKLPPIPTHERHREDFDRLLDDALRVEIAKK